MKAQVVSRPSFSVLGIEGAGPSDKGHEWIRPLWDKAAGERNRIADFVTADGWGLMSAVDEPYGLWTDTGKYLAGWELRRRMAAPAGWTVWEVPAATFVAINCTLVTYREAWDFVVTQYLPTSKFERVGAFHEYYPPEFRSIDADSFSLYFPVRPRG